MKVGILTYHQSYNYGALLQAVATRLVLQQMGHKVTYIDYWPEYHQRMYALPKVSRKNCLLHPRFAFLFFRDRLIKVRRKNNFEQFKKKYILPYCSKIDEKYDIVVCGSDQIWRKQPYINTFNPIYFGDNHIYAKRQIAYAASIDRLPENFEDKQLFKSLLAHLDSISVREDCLLNFVKELGYSDAITTLDPTLLLDAKTWNKEIPMSRYGDEKYVLWYELQNNSFDSEEVHRFADSIGCTVKKIVGHAYYSKDDSIDTTCSPDTFLKYIYNSEYVITSSFHGLVFSIIFHKPFIVSFLSNSNRAKSLLQLIGHSERMIKPQAIIPQNNTPIDYKTVDKIIDKHRELSLCFLLSNTDILTG